jgi:hypothetical protein
LYYRSQKTFIKKKKRLGVSLVNSWARVGMVAARRDWANTFVRCGIASMAPPL